MRLNLYEKNKNIWLYTLIAIMLPIIILHVVQLRVFASGEEITSTNSFPLPFGPGSNWGYSNPNDVRLPNDAEILDLVDQIETSTGNTVYGLFIYEIASDYSYVVFAVAFNDFWYLMPNDTYPAMPYNDYLNLRRLNGRDLFSCQLWKLENNGTFYYTNGNNNTPDQSYFFSSGVSHANTFYYWYPFWHKDFEPIQVSSNWSTGREGFVYRGVSGGGPGPAIDFDAPGFGSGSYEVDPDTGDVSGFSFDFNLDFSSIGDHLTALFDNLSESLGSWFDPIHDNLDTIIDKLDDILDNMGAILDRMSPNNLTTQNFGDATGYLLNNFVKNSPAFKQWVDLGTSFKDFYDELFDDSDFENPVYDDDFPVVEYEAYWFMPTNDDMDEHPEFDDWYVPIHFKADFRWYERIREPFLKVFMTFFTIGFLFYAIKQVPNILHGVAGGVSNGSSVAEGIHDIATLHPKKKGGD